MQHIYIYIENICIWWSQQAFKHTGSLNMRILFVLIVCNPFVQAFPAQPLVTYLGMPSTFCLTLSNVVVPAAKYSLCMFLTRCEVKRGYYRNYLFPEGIAIRETMADLGKCRPNCHHAASPLFRPNDSDRELDFPYSFFLQILLRCKLSLSTVNTFLYCKCPPGWARRRGKKSKCQKKRCVLRCVLCAYVQLGRISKVATEPSS